jgi:hypothetical protein
MWCRMPILSVSEAYGVNMFDWEIVPIQDPLSAYEEYSFTIST